MEKKDRWTPSHYKKHSVPQETGALKALEGLCFKGNETVLDIGCGAGNITKAIADRVPRGQVIGIDVSPKMIEECKKTYAEISNLSFVLADATNFHFDIQFDLVVSFSALHYVADHLAVLRNIFQSLKSKGKLVILMSGGEQTEIAEVFNREPWKTLLSQSENKWHGTHEEQYKKWLLQAGFQEIYTQTIMGTRIYPSKKELFNWAWGWVPYVTGLEKEKAMEFTNVLVENIAKGQKEDSIAMSSPLLRVEATKP